MNGYVSEQFRLSAMVRWYLTGRVAPPVPAHESSNEPRQGHHPVCWTDARTTGHIHIGGDQVFWFDVLYSHPSPHIPVEISEGLIA